MGRKLCKKSSTYYFMIVLPEEVISETRSPDPRAQEPHTDRERERERSFVKQSKAKIRSF